MKGPNMFRIKRQRYWSTHTHSEYSARDAAGTVADIVARAREIGYRGLALTDHGNIAGAVELYKECRKNGIKPFPGCEMYLVEDRNNKSAKRYHFCVLAYTTQGYRNLIHLVNLSHENFYHKPIVDLADLARLAEEGKTEGLALTTGCFFGYVTQTLVNDGPKEARRVVKMFSGWFDTYVELQKHKIFKEDQDEDWIADQLLKIADELELPVVLGQDSHYIHADQQPVHDAMKQLVSFSDDPDEAVFPGDGFHMVDDQWMIDHHGQEVFDRAMEGHKRLLDKHDMYVEELERYEYRIPHIAHDPEKALIEKTSHALAGSKLDKKQYWDRLGQEMETVRLSGMSDYFLLVADVCEYMRDNGIEYQTRGSAAGSLIAYLLGITNVDPIKWKTSFDRFMGKPARKYDPTFVKKGEAEWLDPLPTTLEEVTALVEEEAYEDWKKEELALLATNEKALRSILQREPGVYTNPDNSTVAFLLGITDEEPSGPPVTITSVDRKSPPDIDLDVDNQRRAEVIEWLNERYSVMQIGNWSEMGFKTDPSGEQSSDSSGSIVVKYFSAMRKRLAMAGKSRAEINEALEWENVPSEDKRMLQELSDLRPISGAGTHACGLILCNNSDEMEALVPKMWVPNSKIFVSQFHMKRVEEIGLVKLDLLGSKTVTVMSRCAKDLGFKSIEDLKESEKFTFTDSKVYQAMGHGYTEGVFQLEGYSSMMGIRSLKPKKISDVVAAMALFRPATMEAGATDQYLDRRFKRADTPQRHDLFESVIKETNGIILYQDQVIDILRSLGMDPADLTLFLKAIKASNKNQAGAQKTIDAYLPLIKTMCDKKGVSDEDWAWLQGAFQAAAGYGFNKAHATVYGITAYVTQWLQVHHPDIFFANLISVHIDDPDRITKYERAARQRKVRILRADVLESSADSYRVPAPGVVRRPLKAIHGVGAIAAQYIEDAQPFKNFEEFMDKANYSKVTGLKDFKPGITPPSELKGVLSALYKAMACDSIGGVPVGPEGETNGSQH